MSAGLQRVLVLVFLITLGFYFKQVGVIKSEARKALGEICFKVTLPCVIIRSYSSFDGNFGLLWIIPLGLAGGMVMIGTIIVFCRNRSKEDLATAAMSCSSVSIGAFAIPFLQEVLTAQQLLIPVFYDVGNGIIAFGGSAAIGHVILRRNGERWYLAALRSLVCSVPVWAFLTGLVYHLAVGKLPDGIYTALDFIGGANSVLSMLYIGSFIEFPKKLDKVGWAVRLLAIHYGTVILLALVFYYLLPFGQAMRSILTTLLFAPLSLGGLVAVDSEGLDRDTAGLLNTITILIGIIMVTALIPTIGLS